MEKRNNGYSTNYPYSIPCQILQPLGWTTWGSTTAQNYHLVMPSIFMLLSFTQRLFVPCVRFIHSVSEVLMSPVSLGGFVMFMASFPGFWSIIAIFSATIKGLWLHKCACCLCAYECDVPSNGSSAQHGTEGRHQEERRLWEAGTYNCFRQCTSECPGGRTDLESNFEASSF